MRYLQCSFPEAECVGGLVTRPYENGLQTLCLSETIDIVNGGVAHDGIDMGPPVELMELPRGGGSERPFAPPNGSMRGAEWDPYTASTFFSNGKAIYRMVGTRVHLVAGRANQDGTADGRGNVARFRHVFNIASDGQGSIYIVDATQIRQIRLPAAWRADVVAAESAALQPAGAARPAASAGARAGVGRGAGAAAGAAAAAAAAVPGAAAGPAAGAAAAAVALAAAAERPAAADVTVTTLEVTTAQPFGLAFDPAGNGGSLLFVTTTALYRASLPASADDPDPTEAVLVAGREGIEGAADGPAASARFTQLYGVTVDGAGQYWLIDCRANSCSVRKISRDGTVSTLVTGLEGEYCRPHVLPNGYLAVVGRTKGFVAIDMGITPPDLLPPGSAAAAAVAAAAAPPSPLSGSLSGDLGALLDAQPDGSADLAIVVGERVFHAHRLILSARCPYFRQRLVEGNFADGAEAQVSLPDADADAFGLVLRWIYTGAVDVPTAAAQAVAELADRLLLPALCRGVQSQVLAGVSAETVVDALLWAEGRSGVSGTFAEMLGGLKTWYVENHGSVLREARASVKRLAAECPDLIVDLCEEVERKRARVV